MSDDRASVNLYGKVSGAHWTGKQPCCMDNRFNLLISEWLVDIGTDEVMSMLAPEPGELKQL